MAKKARNGQGSVYFDNSKQSWRARVPDGSGNLISKRFATEAEAQQWLLVTRANMMTGTYVPPSDITLGGWVNEFIEVYCRPNVRLKTYIGYLQTAAHLEPIKKTPLQDINPRQLQNFINRLQMAASSRLKVYRLLKAAFAKALMLDMIPKNPMLAIRPPKQEQRILEVFTPQEINMILDKLLQMENPRWYVLVRLAAETGMRLGEVLGLKPKNIKGNKIYVECSLSDVLGKERQELPKTKAGYRQLPITPETASLLRGLGGKNFVFETANGTSLRATNVERVWRTALGELSIPFRNFHVLRHTFATTLLSQGVPLNDVAAYLGHSKPSHTLNLYGHAIPARTAEIPNIIGNALSLPTIEIKEYQLT